MAATTEANAEAAEAEAIAAEAEAGEAPEIQNFSAALRAAAEGREVQEGEEGKEEEAPEHEEEEEASEHTPEHTTTGIIIVKPPMSGTIAVGGQKYCMFLEPRAPA
jgi:hypothetical protein